MATSEPTTRFTPYDHTRFPAHLPFGRRGYLFTVPGSFPEATSASANVTDWDMAVYRTDGEWEVRDVNGERRAWGTGRSRRVAVGLAFQEIDRKRRQRAAEIAEKRQNLGLEPVPPFAVQITDNTAGILHSRCGCDPRDAAAWFENEPDAVAYAGRVLTEWRLCPKSPSQQ